MKSIARIIILILIPLTALVACSKEDNQGAVDTGNQTGRAAFAAKKALAENHGIYVDSDSLTSSKIEIQSMSYDKVVQVRRDLLEFRRLTQSFLDWGHSKNVQFIGNSEYVANSNLQNADQLIAATNQRISAFEQGSTSPSNRPRGQDRDRNRNRF